MPQKRPYVVRTYNLKPKTDVMIKEISANNRNISFGEVIDWAVESLHKDQFGETNSEPILEREEMDRR